ncbi:MAG: restriction endonuclease [Burkholderiaceae bacterium]
MLVLLMAWGCAWAAGLGWPVVMAVTTVILIIGIAVAAIRSMPWRNGQNLAERSGGLRAGDEADHTPGTGFSAPVHGKRWSMDVFQSIDARRFAAVCETWFSWAGFETRLEAHRTDEGVDIWLHAAKVAGPVAIVRCKHGLNKPVDLRDMQEFVGVIAPHRSVHGTYTTTSTYTPEALQLAKESGIDAVDGPGLLRRIQTRTRQRQQALLAVAFNGHV